MHFLWLHQADRPWDYNLFFSQHMMFSWCFGGRDLLSATLVSAPPCNQRLGVEHVHPGCVWYAPDRQGWNQTL